MKNENKKKLIPESGQKLRVSELFNLAKYVRVTRNFEFGLKIKSEIEVWYFKILKLNNRNKSKS